MDAILPKKKHRRNRTWVIEGFDGPTCFFQQTLSEAFLPDARIIALLQRLLSRHLTVEDIIDGSTTLRDPFHNPIFETPSENREWGVSIAVGKNPYYVATQAIQKTSEKLSRWIIRSAMPGAKNLITNSIDFCE
jgi:hypothetical protein